MKRQEYVPNEGTRQNPKEELREVETNNLPDKEFKVMIIKMLNKLEKRMDEHREKLTKS